MTGELEGERGTWESLFQFRFSSLRKLTSVLSLGQFEGFSLGRVRAVRECLVSLDEGVWGLWGTSSEFLLLRRLRGRKTCHVRGLNERTPCWSFTPRRLVLSVKVLSKVSRANLCRRFHLSLSGQQRITIMQVRIGIRGYAS